MQVEFHVILSLLFFSHQAIIYFRNLKRVDWVVSDCFLLNYSLHFILSWMNYFYLRESFMNVSIMTFTTSCIFDGTRYMLPFCPLCFLYKHGRKCFPNSEKNTEKKLYKISFLRFHLPLSCFAFWCRWRSIFIVRKYLFFAMILSERRRLVWVGKYITNPQNVNTNARWTKHIPRKPLRAQLIIGPVKASTERLS